MVKGSHLGDDANSGVQKIFSLNCKKVRRSPENSCYMISILTVTLIRDHHMLILQEGESVLQYCFLCTHRNSGGRGGLVSYPASFIAHGKRVW